MRLVASVSGCRCFVRLNLLLKCATCFLSTCLHTSEIGDGGKRPQVLTSKRSWPTQRPGESLGSSAFSSLGITCNMLLSDDSSAGKMADVQTSPDAVGAVDVGPLRWAVPI